MSLTSYITELKEALGGFGLVVYEGPVERFDSLRANSIHEAILITDGDITEEPTDDLESPSVLYGMQVDIIIDKAPKDNEDEAIVKARSVFDDVFPALHGLEPGGFQIVDIEGGRIEEEEYTTGHYQIRCNLKAQEYYKTCR